MEIGVFDCLFGDLSPQGSSDAPGVVVPTFPGLLRGELRWSLSKGGYFLRILCRSFRIHGRFGVYSSIERAVALSKFEARIAKKTKSPQFVRTEISAELKSPWIPGKFSKVSQSFFLEKLDSVPFPEKWFW